MGCTLSKFRGGYELNGEHYEGDEIIEATSLELIADFLMHDQRSSPVDRWRQ
jgi:hypothetical protein